MSGVRRFLSRREKSPHPSQHHHLHRKDHADGATAPANPSAKPPHAPEHFKDIFTVGPDHKKPDKEEEKKIKNIVDRLRHYGLDNITEGNVVYALRSKSSHGDEQEAFRLLMLLQDTYEGILRPYNPNVKLLGAVNREAVTCFLDSLLFAMFLRLDSYEAMLYESFEDAKRKRLAGLIRLWVNMLRTGRLITPDITEKLQLAIATCGWTDAGTLQQQDPSEAFTFITGQLELPMLTLKMDMYHTGKEDPQDDHKFVNERLLEVAILDEPIDGKKDITLEDCLEHYFNNRIEVKRHLENQRRNTLKTPLPDGPTKLEKESGTHIEVAEVVETPTGTPLVGTPIHEYPTQSRVTPVDKLRPNMSRKRADSIFSQRRLELVGIDPEQFKNDDPSTPVEGRLRKTSTRTEVLMPAWQFFKLLPWYTENMPTSDVQVAAHFSKQRPVLGICLKRYSYTNAGQARRLSTYVDIPLEIAVPDFVSDDHLDEGGPLVGNFRLVLQAVVCHRGVSLNSGHYICLARARLPTSQQNAERTEHGASDDGEEAEDPWVRFDDLAKERVSPVDILEALKQEVPYLLFYQVQPIGEDGRTSSDLPTYAEATSRSQSDATPLDKPSMNELLSSDSALEHAKSEPLPPTRTSLEVGVADFVGGGAEQTALDTSNIPSEQPRGRASTELESRRQSIALDTSSVSGSTTGSIRTEPVSSVPSTPSEEKSSTLLSVANKISSRRGSRALYTRDGSRSRPSSREDTRRFPLSMAKLTQMVSNKSDSGGATPAPPPAPPTATAVQPTPAAAQSSDAPAAEPTTATEVRKSTPSPMPAPAANTSRESVNSTKAKHHRRERGGSKRKSEKAEDRDCTIM